MLSPKSTVLLYVVRSSPQNSYINHINMQGNGINIPNYSRVLLSGHDAAEIFVHEMNFIREFGAHNHPCAAHIHFTASKMIENESSGQFYLNNSGYSLPSENIERQISVIKINRIKFTNYYFIFYFVF